MHWHPVEDEPLRIDGPWPAVDPRHAARTVRGYAVPLLRVAAGRLVPLATGSLVRTAHDLYLLTAAHAFDDGVRLGDLRVPLGRGRTLGLEHAACLARETEDDVAVIRLGAILARRLLAAGWRAVGLRELAPPGAEQYVVCGWPVERTRWIAGQLHAKPVTFYTRAIERHARGRLLAFGRLATRADAAAVWTPALEGVSGATAWAIVPAVAEDGATRVSIRPAGVQVSYRHGDFVRCTDWARVADLIDRLDPPAARDMRHRLGATPIGDVEPVRAQ